MLKSVTNIQNSWLLNFVTNIHPQPLSPTLVLVVLKSNKAIPITSIISSTSSTPPPSSIQASDETEKNFKNFEITESSLIIGSNDDVNDGDSDILGEFKRKFTV